MKSLETSTLRCEYQKNPLGIDLVNPRFSWIIESDTHGQIQTAYQILVARDQADLNAEKGTMWDSGKVESDETIQIEYKGQPLQPFTKYFWSVLAWDKDGNKSDWSESSFFVTGALKQSDIAAKWIGCTDKKKQKIKIKGIKLHHEPSPLLRTTFSVKKEVSEAYLVATALGEYEVFVNGKRIGDHELAPEWTDYLQKVQYQLYDVTDTIQTGKNCIGSVIADGWYMGNLGPGNPLKHTFYGQNRRFLCQLIVKYEDGTEETVQSGTKWTCYRDGPIRLADHFTGEIYDMNYEQEGWCTPDFDDAEWDNVVVDETKKVSLVAQKNEPIRIVKEINPVSVSKVDDGKYIYNIGQNIAGWCRVKILPEVFESGTKIKLRHGEMLKEDGTLYTKNLRLAKATDQVIVTEPDGRSYQPSFTYHGFQYVEISGLKQGADPPKDLILGCAVASDCPEVGKFSSSNDNLNRLWKNIFWTQRDNIISVPTDCPQRNERMGWMGDAQVFCQTSMFNMNMASFYSKWIEDIRESQVKDGRYPDFVPHPYSGKAKRKKFSGVPAWADCGVIVPWIQYINYGDKRALRQHFDSMKKYVDWIKKKNKRYIWKKKLHNNYGDWLNGDTIKADNYPSKGGQIPKKVFATLYFAQSALVVSKTAEVLGKVKDAKKYRRLHQNVKHAFNKKYVDDDATIKGDTQAGYALSLHFEMIPEAQQDVAFQLLIQALKKYDKRISTGFCSTLPMMKELCTRGRSDLAYDLLLSHRFPSWFYMIDQGATTMWERWDGYVKGRGFQSPGMNSFNHYSIGAVGEWIYRMLLGINPDEHDVAYKRILFKPYLDKRLKRAEGSYDSIRGRIEAAWKYEDRSFDYHIVIPANTTAEIYIPTSDPDSITEENIGLDRPKILKKTEFDGEYQKFDAKSGSYDFHSLI